MSLADYQLLFADEASSFAVAIALGAVAETEDGSRLVRYTHRWAIDVIGTLYTPGEQDEAGSELVAPEPLPGWHVNFRILDGSELPPELEPFVVHPETPARVWA